MEPAVSCAAPKRSKRGPEPGPPKKHGRYWLPAGLVDALKSEADERGVNTCLVVAERLFRDLAAHPFKLQDAG